MGSLLPSYRGIPTVKTIIYMNVQGSLTGKKTDQCILYAMPSFKRTE